jgi:hypothetical protein
MPGLHQTKRSNLPTNICSSIWLSLISAFPRTDFHPKLESQEKHMLPLIMHLRQLLFYHLGVWQGAEEFRTGGEGLGGGGLIRDFEESRGRVKVVILLP